MARHQEATISTIAAVCIHCQTEHLITGDRDAEQLKREAADITCSFCGKPLGKRRAG